MLMASRFNSWRIAIDLTKSLMPHLHESYIRKKFNEMQNIRTNTFGLGAEAALFIGDPHAGNLAQKIFDDPEGELHQAKQRLLHQQVYQDKDKLDAGEVLFHSRTDGTGHFATMACKVEGVEVDMDKIHNEEILRMMLLSFPQGAVIISPNWMKLIKENGYSLAFIDEHAEEIKKDSVQYISDGEPLKNCGALLGNANLVEISGVVTEQVDGRWLQYMTVVTTPIHAFDGINNWKFSWDPKTGEVIFYNDLIGKHPLYLVSDFFNNFAGLGLMHTMWCTVPELQAAMKDPDFKPLEERLAKNNYKLLARRRMYQSMEAPSKALSKIRTLLGPNMVAGKTTQIYEVDFENMEDFQLRVLENMGQSNLPVTTEPQEFRFGNRYINGGAQLFNADPIMHLANAGMLSSKTDPFKMLNDSVERAFRPEMNRNNIDIIANQYSKWIKETSSLLDLSSTSNATRIFVNETAYGVKLETGFLATIGDDTISFTADEIADMFSKAEIMVEKKFIRAMTEITACQTFLWPLIKPGGVLEPLGRARYLEMNQDQDLHKLAQELKTVENKAKQNEQEMLQNQGTFDLKDPVYVKRALIEAMAREALRKSSMLREDITAKIEENKDPAELAHHLEAHAEDERRRAAEGMHVK